MSYIKKIILYIIHYIVTDNGISKKKHFGKVKFLIKNITFIFHSKIYLCIIYECMKN